MKIPSLNPQQDRAAGSLLGAFIGDAMGLGPHWYYDLDEQHATTERGSPITLHPSRTAITAASKLGIRLKRG